MDDYKVHTDGGKELFVSKSDFIPLPEMEKSEETFGFVKVNGIPLNAESVKIIMQLYDGLLKQYEDLKDAYRKEVK